MDGDHGRTVYGLPRLHELVAQLRDYTGEFQRDYELSRVADEILARDPEAVGIDAVTRDELDGMLRANDVAAR